MVKFLYIIDGSKGNNDFIQIHKNFINSLKHLSISLKRPTLWLILLVIFNETRGDTLEYIPSNTFQHTRILTQTHNTRI